ncbi:MAG: phosphatidylglycerophosphatase A [Desulfovibrio sp.]
MPPSQHSLAVSLATLGPVGRIPFAPGTWGSAAAVLLAPFCFVSLPLWGRLLLLLAVLLVGTWAAGRAEQALSRKDPGCVVIDEVLGQWTALLPATLPSIIHFPRLWEYALAFVLFRFFDILKPFPIRQVERTLPGGFGIMADDLVAGLFAALGLWLIPLGLASLGFPLP